MTTATEPRTAELPLASGRKDATVRLHPLLCGEAKWPEAWPHRVDGPLARAKAMGLLPGTELISLPIVAFLVEHPSAGPILIDTGLDPVVADHPRHSFGRLLGATAGRTFTMEPSQAVPEQLRARGVDPDDVKVVVMTHLHYDHASGMSQFPGATFVVSQAEWDSFHSPRPMLKGYVRGHIPYDAHNRTLDFEGDRTSSFSTFGRSLDLFGDGSVRAVFTPGHTLGHMSVVLRTGQREVVVAGDAVYTRHTLETGHLPFLMEDTHLFQRSLRELQLHAQGNPDTLVIPGHDMATWRELDAVYD